MKTLNFKFLILKLIFIFNFEFLFLNFSYSEDIDPVYLSQTMECEFTSELTTLAAKLDHDAIKIYNWVYSNVEYEWYDLSRKGAQCTYLTKRGNNWDQCSLLITLLRISGIPARYVYDNRGWPYVEAYVSNTNYRGINIGEEKDWMPLVSWMKDYRNENGINLFPNGTIPSELNFNFDEYLSSVKQKTVLELFEEKIQTYLNINYPGKTLKDIPYKQSIINKTTSILPSGLPNGYLASNSTSFINCASVPENYRDCFYLSLKRNLDGTWLLQKKGYLSEIAGKRFCLDFIPASANDAQIISSYGGMCKTPAGAALLKPVLKINGSIIQEGTPIYTGELFTPYIGPERPSKKAGTFIQFSFDVLDASQTEIQNLKNELIEIFSSTAFNDSTREQYLGRTAQIFLNTYESRLFETIKRTDDLFYSVGKHGGYA